MKKYAFLVFVGIVFMAFGANARVSCNEIGGTTYTTGQIGDRHIRSNANTIGGTRYYSF